MTSMNRLVGMKQGPLVVAVCVIAGLVGFAISCGITMVAVGGAAVLGGLAGGAAS